MSEAMVYQFTMIARSDGRDEARWSLPGGDLVATSKGGAAAVLARKILAQGPCVAGGIEARGTDGRLRWRHPSLHALATRVLVETDQGMRWQKWRPNPMAGRPAV